MKLKTKKRIILLSGLIMLALPSNVSAETNTLARQNSQSNPSQIITLTNSTENIIVPFADIIEWRYKSINRKLYRRQYNYSKQVWIGYWEAC
jgi:hypothetical protein